MLQTILLPLIFILHTLSLQTQLGCYSSIPSGSSNKGLYTYQSSLYCGEQCSSYSYFALYDGSYCYCLSSKPTGDTVDTCNEACTGYPDETCGGSDSYTVYSTGDSDDDDDDSSSASDAGTLSAAASDSGSSAGPASLRATTSSSSSSSSSSSTDTDTAATTTSSSSSSSSVATTKSPTSTSDDPVTSVVTKSANGATSVVTITSTPTSDSDKKKSDSKSGSNKGAIIGGAVGGVVAALAIVGLLVFVFCYMRRKNSSDDDSVQTFVDDAIYDELIKRQPQNNPFESPEDFNMNVDQRLNPIELGNRRISEGSLLDHLDYSRKILRVANPDDNV